MRKTDLNSNFELRNDAGVAAHFAESLQDRTLLSNTDFAKTLGVTLDELNTKNQAGEVYKFELNAERFSPKRLQKLSALFPEVAGKIEQIQDLVELNNYEIYPSWQILLPEDPNQGSLLANTIRPEVIMVRRAYEEFAKEVNAEGLGYPPSADDHKLFFFFNSSAGLSGKRVSDHIVEDKKVLTADAWKKAWWYHENPYCGFS